jgi:hypothetical protein
MNMEQEIKHVQVMPYIDQGELVVEIAIDGIEVTPIAQKITQVFEEFLDYRRNKNESGLNPEYREEVVNMVATLRSIARELEIETDGLRGGLH